jgi:hypothetical protein
MQEEALRPKDDVWANVWPLRHIARTDEEWVALVSRGEELVLQIETSLKTKPVAPLTAMAELMIILFKMHSVETSGRSQN